MTFLREGETSDRFRRVRGHPSLTYGFHPNRQPGHKILRRQVQEFGAVLRLPTQLRKEEVQEHFRTGKLLPGSLAVFKCCFLLRKQRV